MAKFLTGNELNLELENIFENAYQQLILISPYIKLHDRYLSVLRTKKDNPKIEIILVFGKNEEDISKSMKQEDFNFLKDFANIQIRYERRLHAKYYANEASAILTSMNLYSYSQDNNIEAGVMTKASVLGDLANSLLTNIGGDDSLDNQALNYFKRVIKQSELLFCRRPQYESVLLGLTKRYKESITEVDNLSDFFNRVQNDMTFRKNTNFQGKFENAKVVEEAKGFCIRTGKQIPFNPKLPMCDAAYQSWSNFSNHEYPEKYCHFSGEISNGETSYSKPIMRKNWNKAKNIF